MRKPDSIIHLMSELMEIFANGKRRFYSFIVSLMYNKTPYRTQIRNWPNIAGFQCHAIQNQNQNRLIC